MAIIGVYNFARFGNPLEAGYTYEVFFGGMIYRDLSVPGNIAGPLFRLSYIPINFRTLAFGLPNPEGVSVSLFLISPFLIYLFSGKRWNHADWIIAINALVIVFVLLAFRSIGFSQASFRYSLDFMPFVFWLLARGRSALTTGLKALILAATAFDLWLVAYFVQFRF